MIEECLGRLYSGVTARRVTRVAETLVDAAVWDTAGPKDSLTLKPKRAAFASKLDSTKIYLRPGLNSSDSTQRLAAAVLMLTAGSKLAQAGAYSLVIIDVEGDGRVPAAERLCSEIKKHRPDQEVVFICNHRVSVNTDCPDEIIRTEFNPQAMLDGVKAVLNGKPSGSQN